MKIGNIIGYNSDKSLVLVRTFMENMEKLNGFYE